MNYINKLKNNLYWPNLSLQFYKIYFLFDYINKNTVNGKRKINILFTIILIIILSIIVFLLNIVIKNSNILMLLSLVVFSTTQALSSIPTQWKLSKYSAIVLNYILFFLKETKILKLCLFIYELQYGLLTYKEFKIYTIILGLFFLFYISLARYILYLKMSLGYIPLYISILYSLSLLLLFLRSFSTFSVFIVLLIFYRFPDYQKEILLFPVDTDTNTDSPSKSLETPTIHKHYSFMNRFNIVNNIPPEPPKVRFNLTFGRAVSVVGLCFTGFACYHYSEQTRIMRIQADAAVRAADEAAKQADAAVRAADEAAKQADAAARAADVSEVAAGLKTKESYMKRWYK